MQESEMDRMTRIRNNLLFAVSLIPLMLFGFVLFSRMALPFILEWGEGAAVNQIQRILNEQPLYARPDKHFAALVYTPIYYYISAGMARLSGDALLGARIISLLSILGSVILIASLIWQETKNGLASWLAGAFFLGCFALSDGYFDLARVDSLYVCFALLVYTVTLKVKKPVEFLALGLLISIGFYIKQSFLILFAPFLAALAVKQWRQFLLVLSSAAAGIIMSLILIQARTDGWFSYYIFQLPREHSISIMSAVNFWIGDTTTPLAIAILIAAAYFGIKFQAPGKQEGLLIDMSSRLWKHFFLGAGFILAAWATRSTAGGGANNVMPLYAFLAVSFGLGIDELRSLVNHQRSNIKTLLDIAIILQFTALLYNPFNLIPTPDEIEVNLNIKADAASAEKPLFVPYRSQLAITENGPGQIHIVNLFEMVGYFGGEIRPEGIEIINLIRQDICEQDFSLIILDQPIPWFDLQIESAYQQSNYRNLADMNRSDLLAWQLGAENTFKPIEGADQELCLETISR